MTISPLRRWFRDPLFLLALAAGLIAFCVQSGELGTADTTHRLQSAHALWTSEPPVFPQEYPEFGIHGRGGSLQSWYGIGQSLLMLPFDIVGTYVEHLSIFARYDGNDPSVRSIVVSYGTSILVTVLTALVCFRFLRLLSFSVRQSVLGVLALSAHADGIHLPIRMAAHRKPAGAPNWLRSTRTQPAHPSHYRNGPIGWRSLCAAGLMV
jgi:hypothetical protein